MSGRRSFSATVISRTSSENVAPSRAPGKARKAASIANALSRAPTHPRRSLDSILGNGNIANRRASEGDSDPFAKHGGKGSQTVEEFDSDANKENIAPFRVVSLTTPSPVRRRPARRFYSDSFTRPSTFTTTDRDSTRVHVIKLTSLDVEESDRDSKTSGAKKAVEKPLSVATPPRLTKNATTKTLESNGKVLLRVDKAAHETDSSDSENSESDSDSDSGPESDDALSKRPETGVKQEDDKPAVEPTEDTNSNVAEEKEEEKEQIAQESETIES